MQDDPEHASEEPQQSEQTSLEPTKITLDALARYWVKMENKRILEFKARDGGTFRTLGQAVQVSLNDDGIKKLASVARAINNELLNQGYELWPGRSRFCAATDASLQRPLNRELSTTAERAEWADALNLKQDEPNFTGHTLIAQRKSLETRLRAGENVFIWVYFPKGYTAGRRDGEHAGRRAGHSKPHTAWLAQHG